MKALLVVLLFTGVLAGCAGMREDATLSCPAAIPAPQLRVGDTWRWQDEKGAKWYRRFVRETEDGLLEAASSANAPRYFYDQTHTLRRVLVKGQEVTDATLDFPMVGKPVLEFPLVPGHSWGYMRSGRSAVGNDLLSYRTTRAVQGCARVTVPAGTFLAVIITEEQGIIGRADHGWRTWWYSPEIKYFIKLTHGHASHPWFWQSFRDWALTGYEIKTPMADGRTSVAARAAH